MPAPDSTPVRYLPYELPLRLASALRHAARLAHRRLRRHWVPGGRLVCGGRRPWARAEGRAGGALAWRSLRSTPGAVLRAASPSEIARRIYSHWEQVVRQGAPLREPHAARRKRPGGAASAPAETAGLKKEAVPAVGGVAPGLLVWTRIRRRGTLAARGATPLPGALLVGRQASARLISGIQAAGLTPAPARKLVIPAPALAPVGPARALIGVPAGAPAPEGSRGTRPPSLGTGPWRSPGLVTGRPAPPLPGRLEAPGLVPSRAGRRSLAPAGEPGLVPAERRLGAEAEIEPSGSRLAWKRPALAASWPALERLVERTVAREIGTWRHEPPPSAAPVQLRGAGPEGPRVAPLVVTEQMVVQLVSRLRALAREERFRSGRRR